MSVPLFAAAGRRVEAPQPRVVPELGLVDITQPPYNADRTGSTDCTAILQRAINDHVGQYDILYFPPGVYLVSDTLYWRDRHGQFTDKLAFQGAGRDQVVLRLVDGADGFGDPQAPKAVVFTASALGESGPTDGGKDHTNLGEGNEGYRNNIADLTIETGDNVGAVGIDWLAHNNGVIEWVALRGAGFCGIDMSRRWPGPCLLRHVEVEGFRYGIRFRGPESNAVGEDVTLKGQSQAAVHNSGGGLLSFHRLFSINAVPALESHDSGTQTVLINCDFVGGASNVDAIVGDGGVTAEHTAWRGYRHLQGGVTQSPSGVVVPLAVRHTGDYDVVAAARDHPTVDVNDTADWALVTDFGADATDYGDDTEAVRAAMQSGARVIVFPNPPNVSPAMYMIADTVAVPASVEAVIGWHSSLSAASDAFSENTEQRSMWLIQEPSDRPLMFRGLRMGTYQGSAPRLDPMIDHVSERDLVLDKMTVSARTGYEGRTGAGDLYCSEYCCGRIVLARGQRLWARHLNIEDETSTQLHVPAGAEAWILGMKTEQPVTAVDVEGRLAMLGGFHSAIRPPPPATPCVRIRRGGRVWLAYGTSGYRPGAYYDPQIEDVDQIVLRTDLLRRGGEGSLVSLYRHGD